MMSCPADFELAAFAEECGGEVVATHLQSCERCRAEVHRMSATHGRVSAWFSDLAGSGETEVDVDAAFVRLMETLRVPETVSAEDHLARLLAPDTEIPWYRSIAANIRETLWPEKLPALALTSTPIAVKDIWGRGTSRGALALSVLLQGGLVAGLVAVGTSDVVRKKVEQMVLIAPPPAPTRTVPKDQAPAGGGSRSASPALKAALPRPAPKAFTPPLVTVDHPALTLDASLVAPPDAWAAPSGAIGNPLGQIGGGSGFGSGGGIGNGRGTGIGSGAGSGVGGSASGIFELGKGVTPPELASSVEPEYSEEARKARFNGMVELSIVVNTDGVPEQIHVVKSVGMGLDEKAMEAVQKWRFRPGKNKGVPVKTRATVDVNFRML